MQTHNPQQIIHNLRNDEQRLNQGQTLADFCRTLELPAPSNKWA